MRHLDLFSGIGGFALGFAHAGFPPPLAFVEIDPKAQAVLRDHWPEVPVHDDIRSVRGTELGRVDIVTGGFPCQPWSVAGKRAGVGDDRDLWPEMRRVVAACRPRWVVGENVPGLVPAELGLARVLADLGALGYRCVTLGVPAAGVGAPHRRDRIWIVANGHGIGERQPQGPESEVGRWSGNGGEEIAVADAVRASGRQDAGRAPRDEGGDGGRRAVDDHGSAGDGEGRGGGVFADPWAGAGWLDCVHDGRVRRVAPGIRLLAHGLPGRVAALRLLGNAVVPQIAERLGRAILEADARR